LLSLVHIPVMIQINLINRKRGKNESNL